MTDLVFRMVTIFLQVFLSEIEFMQNKTFKQNGAMNYIAIFPFSHIVPSLRVWKVSLKSHSNAHNNY